MSIECLLCDDRDWPGSGATAENDLNRNARQLKNEMPRSGASPVDQRLPLDSSDLPFGLCLFDAGWHPGVVGILAGRVREQTHRPVIAFAPDIEDGQLRGSARSVPGCTSATRWLPWPPASRG